MSGIVEKLTLRFGLKADGAGAFAGHPDVNLQRGGALIPGDRLAWANAPVIRPTAGAAFQAVAQEVKLPPRHGHDGPINAIGIAPDSPIGSVDMVISSPSEQSRHRIAVGAPYVGAIEDSATVYFVPSGAFPAIGRPAAIDVASAQSNRFDLTTCWWDCIAAPLNGGNGLGSLLYPVRLNVYRAGADASAVRSRGIYEGDADWEIVDVGAGVKSQPSLIVITHGRRRVRVHAGFWHASGAAPAPSLRVDGVIARKTEGNNGSDLVDDRTYDNLLAAQALPIGVGDDDSGVTFDYTGLPYFAFIATITGGALGHRGHLSITALDD